MKKLLLAAALAAVALPGVSRAQVFGQFTPADVVPVNEHLFGTYLTGSDNFLGLLAQLRLSFYPGVDFGFQGGLERADLAQGRRTTLNIGGDVRFAVAHAGPAFPVDLAIGGALGVVNADNYHVLILGPSAVASRAFPVGSAGSIVPYAGAVLAFSNLDVAGNSNTDFYVPLSLGAELRTIPGVRISAEFQVRLAQDYGDDSGWAAGVNLPF